MARPRTPTHLKIVAGTAQKCRSNGAEPVAPRSVPVAPAWLSARAAEIFASLSATIDGLGYLAAADQMVLALAASRLEEVEITTAMIEDGGRSYETLNKAGERMVRANPIVAQRAEAIRHAHGLLSELGLSPSARSKVRVGNPHEGNPFAALLRGE